MTTGKIASSTLWQLMAQGIALLLGIASVKLVTLSLSKELVGNYQTAYGYLQIFGILADFGLYAVSVQELSRAREKFSMLRVLFLLRALVTLLSLGGAILLAWILPGFTGTPLPLGITLAAFVPFFTLLSGMFRTAFQIEFHMRPVFLAEVTCRVVTLLLMLAAFLLGVQRSEDLSMYHLFLLFGSFGSLVLFVVSLLFVSRLPWVASGLPGLFQHLSQSEKQEFWRISKLAAPYGFAFLATTLYRQTDVTLIALLRPDDYDLENAYYGIILRIAEVGFLLPTFLLNSALPTLSRSEKENPDMENGSREAARFRGNILLAILTLGSIVAVFSFFWSRPITLLLASTSYLSGPGHAGSDTALRLLSVSMFLSGIVTYCFYLLLTRHAWRKLLAAISAGAGVSLILNILLIPDFGFIGACITSIATHTFLAICLSALTIRKIEVFLPFSRLFQWLGFTISLSGFLVLLEPYLRTEWHTIFIGMLSSSLVLILLKVFRLFPRISGQPRKTDLSIEEFRGV